MTASQFLYSYHFLDPTRRELLDAVAGYEAIRPGLGHAFELQIEVALNYLSRHPEGSQRYHHEIRRKVIDRFPWAIFYYLDSDTIAVVAVLPCAVNPVSIRARIHF